MRAVALWFRPDIKPEHVGVYQTRIFRSPIDEPEGYSHWCGKQWGCQAASPAVAASRPFREGNGAQFKSWRGLEEKS